MSERSYHGATSRSLRGSRTNYVLLACISAAVKAGSNRNGCWISLTADISLANSSQSLSLEKYLWIHLCVCVCVWLRSVCLCKHTDHRIVFRLFCHIRLWGDNNIYFFKRWGFPCSRNYRNKLFLWYPLFKKNAFIDIGSRNRHWSNE